MSEQDTRLPQERLGAIEFAVKYPFSNPESKYGPVLSGIVMQIFSFLIIPAFVVVGYVFKIREHAAIGSSHAPKFEDFAQLAKEGAYGVAALIPLMVVAGACAIVATQIHPSLIVVVYLAMVYFLPAVATIHSVERTILDMYTSRSIVQFAFSSTYALNVLKYIFLAFALTLAVGFGTIVTFGIGVIILLPLFLYARPCFWGHVYYRTQ